MLSIYYILLMVVLATYTVDLRTFYYLFGALIDLLQQEVECICRHGPHLLHQLLDASMRLLLVGLEHLLHAYVLIHLLDLVHLPHVVSAVVILQHLGMV